MLEMIGKVCDVVTVILLAALAIGCFVQSLFI